MRGATQDLDLQIEVEASPDDDDVTRIAPTVRPACYPQLGRYELRYTVATGGMATVHVAVCRGAGGFGKVFALKQIHPHLATERDFVEMFLDEARIASLIAHPNVCSVIDFGSAGGQYFLTMEYLVGVPLARLCWALRRLRHRSHQARVPLIAARLIADACEGLHAAHELSDATGRPLHVVHRDVSPTNLFVTRDGSLKVVDFGVASAAHRAHHTVTGMVKGKFAYMAPEQLRGSPIDRRADIWSLGVVLWEMVTGRSLFRGKNDSETILRVVGGQAPPLDALCEALPSGLDTIVARALSVDRAGRFASARAMGHSLRKWLSQQPEPVDTIEISEWIESLFGQELREQHRLASRALSESTGSQILPRLPPANLAPTPSAQAASGIITRPPKRWSPGRSGGLRSMVAFVSLVGLAFAAFSVAPDLIQMPAAVSRPSWNMAREPVIAPPTQSPTPAPVLAPRPGPEPQPVAGPVSSLVTPAPSPAVQPGAAGPRMRIWLPRPRPVVAPTVQTVMVEEVETEAPNAETIEQPAPPPPEPEDPISENPY